MGLLARKNNNFIKPFFHDVDSVFDSFLNNSRIWNQDWLDPFEIMSSTPGNRIEKINVSRYPIRHENLDNGDYKIEFDVPGLDKEDIKIFYDQQTSILSVTSQKEKQNKEKHEKQSFSYNYETIVQDLDVETIEAKCQKGILTITGKPLKKQTFKKEIKIT